MKKLFILLIIATVSRSLVQCEGALEESPESLLVKENFYQNEADAFAALTAVYGTFSSAGDYPTIYYMALLENRADYSNGRGSQAGISKYDVPLDNTTQSRVFNAYNDLYLGINRANAVIGNLPGIEAMSAPVKAQYIAEAKFLRAFFYMNLVKYWGGVPIRLEEFTSLDQIAAPRASAQEIWDLVINDLTEALPDLADSFPESESGRATVWAAKAALADAYLNTEDWANAKEMANDIIDNGPYTLVEVGQANDFMKIYGPDVVTHAEDIFSAHQTATNGNAIALYIHRANTGYSVGGYHAWLPAENSVIGTSWDTADLRRQFSIYTEYTDVNGVVQPLPDDSPMLFNKYRDPGATNGFQGRNNVPFYRLAEMYLIYAEASSEEAGGPDALATERLNIVRRRGYGLPLNSPSAEDYPEGMSATAFKDVVLKERAYELNLEMKRWNDLLRTGRAQQAIEATGKAWNDTSLLFPLPVDEINNNPALSPSDQNPGY
ncbi:RagB/SusD family nutrient uptake outer membrane protein [Galbibacter pacificus]|uniref:RagB/SusD family nutrient uptake outer membrane protein n=1 Tax=Galbibacter pacificus TaxID=2996052 RepID=A0ABT6FN15_9FLAO|nr:RagB/SusD family nutrient uptake outer membrane protein [Galbibacter pacificus]MDG3581170.1 RagB/SusD family nutrient uptake outer membrane protein [Galbibacter pacificus]MDG3584648.1 RagB/SusD family nutrient uptake outer membrane protein [Galbibacter pacificus]